MPKTSTDWDNQFFWMIVLPGMEDFIEHYANYSKFTLEDMKSLRSTIERIIVENNVSEENLIVISDEPYIQDRNSVIKLLPIVNKILDLKVFW